MTSVATSSIPKNNDKLRSEDWITAARQLLINSGIESVKVRRLASALNVTTGAFYWQYSNLDQLLDDLLKDWEKRNTEPFSLAIEAAGYDGQKQLLAFYRVILLEEQYNPAYDNAVRDWSERSPKTAASLQKIDLYRIGLIHGIFEALGYTGKLADIRARVQYYHQVGYQAMRVQESLEDRLKNVPYYAEILVSNVQNMELGDPKTLHKLLLEAPLH